MREPPIVQPYAPSPATVATVARLRRVLATRGAALDVVVVGLGKSGAAAVKLLRSLGHRVTGADDQPAADLALSGGSDLAIRPIAPETFARADLVVLSPGVPRARPELAAAIERGVVIGEIELASWFIGVPIVGITGTNGKSTTTALVAHVFQSAGWRAFAGGNLGAPLSELALTSSGVPRDVRPPVDVAVVELSSYQLESIVAARFEVACWLNLTPDHADRYPDLEAYAAAKTRIVEQRTETAVAVLNAQDAWCRRAGAAAGGLVRYFSAGPLSAQTPVPLSAQTPVPLSAQTPVPLSAQTPVPLPGTALVAADEARRDEGGSVEAYDLRNDALPGAHNRANMLAAIECVRHFGIPRAATERGLKTFRGLPHRLELVGEVGGVRYYNDSKATNVDSAVIAVRAVPGPKILIAGGKDKGAPWAPLVEAARDHGVRAVLAIGQAAPIVLRAFGGAVPLVEETRTLEAAVRRARALASAGEVVLLSPACASFDQFKNFEHRGDTFRKLVAALVREEKR